MDFTPLNSFFDHIYVITVEAAIERQLKIKENLEGLNFTFFIGAYKKDFTIDELIEDSVYDEEKTKNLHPLNKPMNTGQIGSSWSHRLVYEDMLENNYERILILEDDVVINKEGLNNIEYMIRELPSNWELWYLDYHKHLRRNIGTWITQQTMHLQRAVGKTKSSHKMISNHYARQYKQHLFIAGCHELASAYAINRSAAKKLVDLQTPICFTTDNLLSYSCSNQILKAYVSIPKVFLNESQVVDKRTRASYVEE
jgi:glycosyl transferase family 25